MSSEKVETGKALSIIGEPAPNIGGSAIACVSALTVVVGGRLSL